MVRQGSAVVVPALKVSPRVLQFAVTQSDEMKDVNGVPYSIPVSACTLRVQYDGESPSSSPNSLLTFSVRTSNPEVVRVKGGWGQLLSLGEEATVVVALRKTVQLSNCDHIRLWISYELLHPTSEDAKEFSEISRKWKEQRRIRWSGGATSSGAAHTLDASILWKGRNFDLLNSHSIVVNCVVSVVHSAVTAELEMLRDQVRLRRGVLHDVQSDCNALLKRSKAILGKLKDPTASMEDDEDTGVAQTSSSLVHRLVCFASEIEWMEVVGLCLVVSSTALLAFSL